ncbi:MAG: hypothetical protein ABTQ29_08735 [Siculibacillus sp.]
MTDRSHLPPDDHPGVEHVAAGRIGRIVLAYALAIAAAAIVRTLGLIVEESWLHGLASLIARNGVTSLILVPAATALIAFLAAAPFVTAFAVWAEGRGARSLPLHLVAGALIGVTTQIVVSLPYTASPPVGVGLILLAALAGGVGGWVYWTVAVRSAPPPPPVHRSPHW